MTTEQRLKRLEALRQEYKDPNGRSREAIKLEARALKVAIDMDRKEGKLI